MLSTLFYQIISVCSAEPSSSRSYQWRIGSVRTDCRTGIGRSHRKRHLGTGTEVDCKEKVHLN
jgi:hypothetical protein